MSAFTVVKFTEVAEQGQNPYKVVPKFWVKDLNVDYVTVPYPPEKELIQAFDRIFNCKPPLVGWRMNHVVIERDAETYQAGILYIKRQCTAPLDEETLLLWKLISLECVEKMGSLNPLIIVSRLWTLLWSLVGK